MALKWANLLQLGLKSLSWIYQRPCDGAKGTWLGIAFLFSTLYYQYLVVWLLTEINGDIDVLARTIEGFTTFSQILIKMPPLLIHRSNLSKLIKDVDKFWDPNNFPGKIRAECEEIFKISYYWINAYRHLVFATLFLFYLQPFVTFDLLISCHVPDYAYAFQILLIGEYIYAAGVACYMTGFDGMYVAFCAHICVQMRLINSCVKNLNLNDPRYKLKLKTCIEHHRFLIGFADRMISIYNISLLGQYVISIYLPCMELFILTKSVENPARIVLSLSYLTCTMFQMGLYCFPATAVSDEMADLADSIYGCKWYEGPIHLQKNVAIVMMRAQMKYTITAAGMAEFNRAAYTVVLKASMSFYTLMAQLGDN